MATLYRKYRPQSFGDVIGQDHVISTLQNALARGKIAHAYLFAGPRGTGKTTIARILAKAVNCEKGVKEEPCNKCALCQSIAAGKSLDLIEIDAASNRGIDEIRALREKVKFPPHEAKYKVYIIDEVHMLTREAFNALLKTLEEPPSHAIFVLATTEITKVPATIISRCQVFDFHKISQAALVARLQKISKLEKVNIEPEVLQLVAARAQGAVRDSESLLGQLFAFGQKKIDLKLAREVLGVPDLAVVAQIADLLQARRTADLIALINKVITQGKEPKQLLESLQEYLRRLLIIKASPEMLAEIAGDLTEEQKTRLQKQAESFALADLDKALIRLSAAGQSLADTHLPQLPLEMALIELTASNREEKAARAQGAETVTIGTPSAKETVKPDLAPAPVFARQKIAPPPAPEARPAETPKAKKPAPVSQATKTGESVSLRHIQKRWGEVVAIVAKKQRSLSVLLRLSQPLSCETETLTLALKYDFHKEQITERKNKITIEEALEKIYEQKLTLKAVILDNLEPVKVEEVDGKGGEDSVDQALKTLGGKMVK